jgi:hypothetical protein
MRRVKSLLGCIGALCSLGFLTGCFGDAITPPATNVTGKWVGRTSLVKIEGIPTELRPILFAFDGTLTFDDGLSIELKLTQSQGKIRVAGTVHVGAVLITQSLSVDGRLNERTLNLEGQKQFFKNTPSYEIFIHSRVSLDGKSMLGEWSVYEGTSKVKSGTFSAKRQ